MADLLHRCVIFCFGLCLAAPAFAASDVYGDALPEGAVARLGTTRLRAMCDSIRFSPDGKRLIGANGGHPLRIWDAASGKLIERRPLPPRSGRKRLLTRTYLSPNCKTLVISDGTIVEMWDFPSGKHLDLPLPTQRKGLRCLALSNNRRFLLLEETATVRIEPPKTKEGVYREEIRRNLLLWDTTTDKQRLLAENQASLDPAALSSDGKRFACMSSEKGTRVWESATGKLLWSTPECPGVRIMFAPDGRRLIAANGGDRPICHVWDAATGQPEKPWQMPPNGQVWQFTFSPDGRKLLVPTETDYVLWDPQAGKILHRWPGAPSPAGQAVFAPDGRSVVTYDTRFQRWDVVSGKAFYADVSRLGHAASIGELFFTPDGKRLVSIANDARIAVWDIARSKPLHWLDLGSTPLDAWTLTPDGTTLIGVDSQWRVHRWSLTKGRRGADCQLHAGQDLDMFSRWTNVRFMPDSAGLAIWTQKMSNDGDIKYGFTFWDLKTGRLRYWGGDPGQRCRGTLVALSVDGRLAATADAQVFETRTGQCRSFASDAPKGDATPIFAPDVRLLAEIRGGGVRVRELATGRPLRDLPKGTTYGADFAADGRRLASINYSRHLMIHDLQTGKVLRKWALPVELSGIYAKMRLSPNGRTVATAHTDGTILLWDVPAPRRGGRLTECEAARLWDELADEDPAKAYAAVWRLRDDPSAAASYLRKRLLPVVHPTDDEWKTLVRQLDSESFAEREAASRRLKAAGAAIEPILRRALNEKPTPEQKRRIKGLLATRDAAKKSPPKPLSPQELRIVRAVAVLEGSNTEEARRVLAEWAKGTSTARLTQEATQALARLKWRLPEQPNP